MRASAFLAAQHKAMTDEEFADAKALANLVLINDWLLAIGAIPFCRVCDGTGRLDDDDPYSPAALAQAGSGGLW